MAWEHKLCSGQRDPDTNTGMEGAGPCAEPGSIDAAWVNVLKKPPERNAASAGLMFMT